MGIKKTIGKKYSNRKTKRGGFFFKKVLPETCNISQVNSMMSSKDLHSKYQICCPKTFGIFKNRSTLCRTIDNNFQQALKRENEIGNYDSQTSNSYSTVKTDEVPPPNVGRLFPKQDKWWKFWGGKTRKNKNRRRKKTRRNRF